MIQLLQGNTLDVLKSLPDQTVNCVVTSPPYWGLRAYGTNPQVWQNGHEMCAEHEWVTDELTIDNHFVGNIPGGNNWYENERKPRGKTGYKKNVIARDTCSRCGAWRGELGLEPTPELYVDHLVQIFREARRVLRDDGTLWLNLGDSFYGANWRGSEAIGSKQATNRGANASQHEMNPQAWRNMQHPCLKPKDLVGIPWRVAFALQADGWYLRSDIIWAKPNPMPESVKDRPTKSHEYIFLLSKSSKYYYDADAIKEQGAQNKWGKYSNPKYGKGTGGKMQSAKDLTKDEYLAKYERRNKRSVWTVITKPYRGAHFATFPPKLIEPCILAGCPHGGIVLDPFNGAGTTGLVALQNGRDYIGIDLKPEYLEMTRERLGLLCETHTS